MVRAADGRPVSPPRRLFIEQGTFDWKTYLGPRYVPAGPPSSIPNAWQLEDELFVPFRHSDGHILGLFSIGDPVSGRRLSDEELDVLVAVTLQAAVLVEAAQTSAAWERSQKGLAELLAVSARLLEPGACRTCWTGSAPACAPRSGSTR